MDPLGRNQDTVFEALEKGNFIAPPGGNDRDTEEIPQLRRAMEWLTPGLVLGAMVPYVGENLELAAFLGGLVTLFGCVRLYEENAWCKTALWAAVAQLLGRCLRLFAQTLLPMLLETVIYPASLLVAVIAAAVEPVLLSVGFWRSSQKAGALMAAAAGVSLLLLPLWMLGIMPLIRIAVAALGAVALIMLLAWAKTQ